jgi:hypothetical protein
MSTENYVKFISEQVHKEKVRGFTDVTIGENLELTSEDYINMLHMYIEDLESRFEPEDLQQIQEVSVNTLRAYNAKIREKGGAEKLGRQKGQKLAADKAHAAMGQQVGSPTKKKPLGVVPAGGSWITKK